MFNKSFGQPSATGTGAFGTGATNTFGAPANANPFGQSSMFGKTATGAFGTQPAFGQSVAPSTATGLFGQTMPTATGSSLFGQTAAGTTSAFGQPAQTQTFGFGTAAPQPATNVFGAQSSTGGGLFGTNTTSAFGQNKPAFGSAFGTSGLFSTQQTQQPAPPLFGSTAAAPTTGLFGQPTTTFGSATGTQQVGSYIKFNPILGTDTLQKGGQSHTIDTRHNCITCMKEYENKSLEELRYEDYMVNRKGPQQPTANLFSGAPSLGGFGQPAQPGSSLFSQPAVDPNKSLFGTSAAPGGALSGGTFGSATTGGVFGTQSASNTNTLFGAKPSPFGAATTTAGTGFGAFGATAATSGASGGLFGSTAAKPAFGSTNLFGQPAQPAATGFGTSTGFGSTFGTNTQSTGLFGNQNKPAFGLGASTVATSAPAAFSFGQPVTNQTGGGLFGAKPATSTAPFGTSTFGATGAFGTTNTSNSLFKPATTTAFGFGSTAPTGMGGSTLGMSGGGLFGSTTQKPGGLFGSTGTGTGLFSGGNVGFGTTTGNTFGTATTGLGGSTFGTGNLFGSQPVTQPSTASVAPAAHSAFMAMALLPFGDSPLYKNLLPATGKTDATVKQNNAITQKAMQTSKDLKVTPTSDTKVKVKPLISTQVQMRKAFFEDDHNYSSPVIPSKLEPSGVKSLSVKHRVTPVSDDWLTDMGNKENVVGGRVLKESGSLPTEKSGRRVSFSIPLETPRPERTELSPSDGFYIRRDPLFKPAIHSTMVDTHGDLSTTNNDSIEEIASDKLSNDTGQSILEGKKSTNESGDQSDSKDSSCLDETQGYLNQSSQMDEEWVPHKTGIVLRRSDYYTIPSLDELEALMNDDGTCIVDNFCIGRQGYGNLFYDETMDVSKLDIDSIVHFRHKEVTVYPDEDTKPPVNSYLNRKCQVTLERVWPIDKTTREPITDVERLKLMHYEDKLRRCTGKMKAHFVEYRPHTGSWVFRVDHFSKYGLSDSENEEEEIATAKPPPLKPPLVPAKSAAASALSPILVPKQQCFTLGDSHLMPSVTQAPPKFPPETFNVSKFSSGTFDVSKDVTCDMPMSQQLRMVMDMEDDEEEEEEDDEMVDKIEPIVGLTQSDAHRVQLMKSSLFHSVPQDEEIEDIQEFDSVATATYSRNLQTPIVRLSISASDRNYLFGEGERLETEVVSTLPPLLVRPKVVNLINKDNPITFSKSTLGQVNYRLLAECGLMMGRRFRPGWGPFSKLTCLTTRRPSERKGTLILNSHSLVQQMSVFEQPCDSDSIEKHLDVRLKYSLKNEDDEGFPRFSPVINNESLDVHRRIAVDLDVAAYGEDVSLSYSRRVWELIFALWGSLSDETVDSATYNGMQKRKDALTTWLKNQIDPEVEKEAANNTDLPAVFSYLTSLNVTKACKISRERGEHYMALLLCCGPAGKLMLQKQLSEWTDVGSDKFIEKERLKIYTLAAGLPVLQGTDQIINICKGLDWYRVFALHFWYLTSPERSIADVVNLYEKAFFGEEPYADQPYPPYYDKFCVTSDHVILDMCFHLLKLYSSRSYSLEQLLNPATYTADPLDYSMSWLLEKVLTSLGYNHLSDLSSAVICSSFTSQLEAIGLWKWAVFVCLHIEDPIKRKQGVLEVIGRNVALLEEREMTEDEAFIVEKLGVAAQWLYKAKAVRALSLRSYHDATFYLMHADEFNQAHQTMMEHLAPDLVINEKHAYLRDILDCLSANADQISEWSHQGQLLLDYLEVSRQMQQVLQEQDGKLLEAMLPLLASICSRVVRFPIQSAKHRLCQAEIAKGTAHIYVNVKRFDRSESALRDVKMIVSKLPMPQDYLSELLQLINEALRELPAAAS